MRRLGATIGAAVLAMLAGSGADAAPVANATCYGSLAAQGHRSFNSGKIEPGSQPAHEVAIFHAKRVIGWIYQERGGALWVETAGAPGTSDADADLVISVTGAKNTFAGGHQSLHMPFGALNLAAVRGESITITGCF